MTQPSQRKISPGTRLLGIAIAGCLLAALALAGVHLLSHNPQASSEPQLPDNPPAGVGSPSGSPVCGQRVLDSPFSYDGQAGAYASGTPHLPTYGTPQSDFPEDTAGVVLATGANNYMSYQLKPYTVYYLLPGKHTGGIQANKGDVFVGGRANGISAVLSGDYSSGGQAIDSNETDGNQSGVTIEYLTIEKYQPMADAAAINQEANTGWKIQYNTITLNVPGPA